MARSASALVKKNRGLRTENQAKAKVMNLKHKERKMKNAQLDNPTTLINNKQATSVSTLDHSGSSSDDVQIEKKRKFKLDVDFSQLDAAIAKMGAKPRTDFTIQFKKPKKKKNK